MPIGLLGKKLGMTHLYDPHGRRMAVTAIQAGPCTVLRLREPTRNGYQAVQVGFETIKELKVTKPVRGQCKQSGAGPFRYIREFRYQDGEWKVGQQVTVEIFEDYELVDVTGISIGKGFQGGGKRYHWSGGPKSHGSMSHRAPGSIGAGTSPGRVLKGHHLPGHMGAERVTVQNLRVVRRDLEHNLLLVEGAIPGAEQELVMIRKSATRPGVIKKPHTIEVDDVEEGKKSKGAAKAAKARAKS